MKYKAPSLLIFLCLCAACHNSKANHAKAEIPADTITVFTMPAIPTMLNTPELRADYLVRHYWENINFADTNYVHHPEITEQAWVDYIDLMKLVPAKTADNALKELFAQAERRRSATATLWIWQTSIYMTPTLHYATKNCTSRCLTPLLLLRYWTIQKNTSAGTSGAGSKEPRRYASHRLHLYPGIGSTRHPACLESPLYSALYQ